MNKRGKAFLPGVLVGAAVVLVAVFLVQGDDEEWPEMERQNAGQNAGQEVREEPVAGDPGADETPRVDRNDGQVRNVRQQRPPTEPVYINGKRLRERDLEELFETYGIYPAPGRWWYDRESGLFGADGQPSLGFMHPGHEGYGGLRTNCSKGRTDVFLNGRRLPASEVAVIAAYFQTQVMPGRYWLDGLGNVGVEGNTVPIANLYTAAAAWQAAGGSGAGGGDNFWSSRFSAGNSTADGSAGYVMLPGGGSVTYGM